MHKSKYVKDAEISDMLEESELSLLVSNVVNENRFSHCRLCLKEITEQYVRFNDFVTLDSSGAVFETLSTLLKKALCSEEMFEEITGIDAVCLNCVDKALDVVKFIDMFKNSNQVINKVFNQLLEILSVDIDTSNNESMYVVVTEKEADIILVNKNVEEKETMIIKQKGRKKRKQFQCIDCDEVLFSMDDFKAHNIGFHNLQTCNLCQETFSTNEELEIHLNTIHQHLCPHCNLRMDSEEELKEHIGKNHNTYVCKECGISCQGLDKLRAHELKHVVKNECPKCGKTYSTKEFFQKHVKLCLEDRLEMHPIRNEIVKTLFCDICGKGYSTKGGLRVHHRFSHGNAKPHECKFCGKQFTAPSYLKTHMIKHTGEKNFKCDICSNKFVSKEALLYHTRRHTGEKPYSCKFCSERFVNASARAEHIKFKHVGPTLMCEICSHKFVTSHFLKQHMNRHHDPTSKLYVARTPDMPGEENMKIKYENKTEYLSQ